MTSWASKKHPKDSRNNREGAGIHSEMEVTASVKKCAEVVCNKDKMNPISFSRKWGEDKLPIVDQYTCLGVEISKDCSWDIHLTQ